jgi:hypothetical protein
MKTMTLEEFHQAFKAQGVKREDYAMICPMCAGPDFDSVETLLGFSCAGRFTGAGAPERDSGNLCNWTLGGLFHTHKLEVITPDGKHHPRFEPATPEQAQAHAALNAEKAAA